MITRVLVPLDVYDLQFSLGIMPYVASLAKGLDIPVLVMSIVDPDKLDIPEGLKYQTDDPHGTLRPGAAGILLGTPSSPPIAMPGEEERPPYPHQGREPHAVQILENVRFEAQRRLVSVVQGLRDRGISAESTVAVSRGASEEILRIAEKEGCDLIAMATHDRGLLARAVRGSVTNEVMLSSPAPVLAITPGKEEAEMEGAIAISQVFVPLDGSAFAEAALPYAEHIARKMGVEMVLVRVVADREKGPASTVATPGESGDSGPARYLKDLADRLSGAGIRVRWELLEGDAGKRIAQLSRDASNEMIAMASHRRTGLSRWTSGSVADELIRNSGAPVMVVPSSDKDDGE